MPVGKEVRKVGGVHRGEAHPTSIPAKSENNLSIFTKNL